MRPGRSAHPAGRSRHAALAAARRALPGRAARGRLRLPAAFEWRPLKEGRGAQLTESISYAKVLALHQEVHGLYSSCPAVRGRQGGAPLPGRGQAAVDQAWGSVLEVPAGSRLHLSDLGYFCHSHTVV